MISNNLTPADAGQGTAASTTVDDGGPSRGAARQGLGSDFSTMLRGLGADPAHASADRGRGRTAATDATATDAEGARQAAARRQKTNAAASGAGDEAAGAADWSRPTHDLATSARGSGRLRDKADAGAGPSDAASVTQDADLSLPGGVATLDQPAAVTAATAQATRATLRRSEGEAALGDGGNVGDVRDAGDVRRGKPTVGAGAPAARAAAPADTPRADRLLPSAGAGPASGRGSTDPVTADPAIGPSAEGRVGSKAAATGRRRDDPLTSEGGAIDRPSGDRGSAGRTTAATAATGSTSATAAAMAAAMSGTAAAAAAVSGAGADVSDVSDSDRLADRAEVGRRETSGLTRRPSVILSRPMASNDAPTGDQRAAGGDAATRATSTVELASADGSALRAVAERDRAAGTGPQHARAQDLMLHLPSTPTPGVSTSAGVPSVVIAPALHDPAFAQALGQQVRLLVNGEIKVADMVVTPPEMGPVRIELSVRGDSADVVFTAAAPETLRAIEASGEVLRAMLAERGISLGSMDVGQGQAQSSSQTQGDGASHRQHAPGRAETTGQNGASAESTARTPAATSHRRGIVDLFA